MVASTLAQGILPGLETAEKLRMGRAARESQSQADMIALSEFNREEQQTQLEAQAAQNLLRTMQGEDAAREGGTPAADNFGDYFHELGVSLINAGAPKRGQELLVQSLDYRKKQSDIDKTDLDMQETRLGNMKKAGEYFYNTLGVAGNESEYRHILDTIPEDVLEIVGPENIEALRNSEWSPELQAYLRDQAMSIKDQATLALTERRTVASEQRVVDSRNHQQVMQDLGQGRLDEQRRTNDRLEKAGGPAAIKAATPQEIAAAQAVLNNSIPGLADISDSATIDAVNHALHELVGRAKTLLNENRGIDSFDQALSQAYMEADAAGDFEVITKRKGLTPWTRRDETAGISYKRKGRSADNPSPMPEGDEAEIARRLVNDRYYETPLGVLKWNGQEFEQ